MNKLTIYNKLFIAFFALLIMFIIWKVPHENNVNLQKQTVDKSK
jgi:hypothetical protein